MLLMREKPFDPSDTELLRALHSRNSKNIRNPLIFLQKMASYSCFWRVPSSKILLQASLHRIYDLLTLVSSYVVNNKPPASASGDLYSHDFYSIVVPASPVRLHSALFREVIMALRPFPASKKLTEAEIFGSMEANSNCPSSI